MEKIIGFKLLSVTKFEKQATLIFNTWKKLNLYLSFIYLYLITFLFCRAQDVEFNVPPEYLINFAIRDKLTAPVLKKLQEDLLFFLFYTNIGDIMQLMAAAEL